MKKENRIVLIVCCSLFIVFLIYALDIFYAAIKNDSKTTTKRDSSALQMSKLFELDNKRITDYFVTSYDGQPICYEYIIDSCYQMSITRVGKIKDTSVLKQISVVKSFIKGRFNERLCTPFSPIQLFAEFDSGFLPLNSVDSIVFYTEGGVVSCNNNCRNVWYAVRPGSIIITFNGHNSQDLYFSFDETISNQALLFFTTDSEDFLFAGLTNIPADEKDVNNIF